MDSWHCKTPTCVEPCALTVAVSLPRASALVAAAVLAPLQGRQGAVGQAAALHAALGSQQRVLRRGRLWRRGKVCGRAEEEREGE